jgi:hypothetical protein
MGFTHTIFRGINFKTQDEFALLLRYLFKISILTYSIIHPTIYIQISYA